MILKTFLQLFKSVLCGMRISPDISINKKCHSQQGFLAFKCECGLTKVGSSRWLQPLQWLLRSWGNARISHLPHCHSLRWTRKETGSAPDSWGAYERNEFSEPRGLHLPIQRMLNSLTWYLIFNVQRACSLCCKLVYSLTPPPTSLEQFSQSYWDAVSPSWDPKHST